MPDTTPKGWRDFILIIEDEVNVKEVDISDTMDTYGAFKMQVNFPAAGKRLGAKMKAVSGAVAKGEWKALSNGDIQVGDEKLLPDEYKRLLEPPKPDYKKQAAPFSTNDAPCARHHRDT